MGRDGAKIADPKKMLLGQGNQYRYILVGDIKKFPKAYIKQLLKEAHAFSLSKVKDKTQIRKGETITKSIAAVKRTKGSKKKKK